MIAFTRFMEKVSFEALSGCWLWTGRIGANGYGTFWLDGKNMSAHRASWLLHGRKIGPLQVLHDCDVRACVNPSHLFLGAHRDNMADMVAKGRAAGRRRQGARHPMAKLTTEQIAAIRLACSAGVPQRQTAKRHDIGQSTVSAIANGLHWGMAA